MEKVCRNCRFYNEQGRDCRRFPPQVWGDPQSKFSSSYCCNFPEVSEDDWCGEFKPIDKYEPSLIREYN